ncbi:XRE family transcriptional regulator [Ornithinimicrobium pratense]|uniref:XRE family transcriptional regulator n=1 Tax=Ornithinimicrobium pratense TaxID=2593973 RepID=A0A5J6V955_9MICO|nr:XRE family transcriptional regulator [Ornithinimicrobium pratense]QFG69716.1 XRE family transcriptional regulator [Ornithinimicrobium pratense]
MSDFGAELRTFRLQMGLTQAELARRSGMPASNLCAYESGRRPMSRAMLARLLDQARRQRPSVALASAREDVIATITAHGGSEPAVFGSVARARDTTDSDLDLLVTMAPESTLVDLIEMEHALEELLHVKVEVLSRGGLRGPDDPILQDAVPL